MPSIPATRKKVLKNSKEDIIQWNLTNHHYKYNLKMRHHEKYNDKTTIEIAKSFLRLLNNTNNEARRIEEIVNDITHLYQSVSFDSKQFLEHVITHATSSKTRLLVVYHKLVSQLHVLALSIRLIFSYIPNMVETLVELISFEEDKVAEAYIESMQQNVRHELIIEGGRQLVNWNESIRADYAKFLLYLLKQETLLEEQKLLLMQLIRLNNSSTTTHDVFRYLQKAKQNMFMTHMDKQLTKLPIFQHLSSWFFEFDPDSEWKLIDLMLHSAHLNSMPDQIGITNDISLLLYIYHSGCQQLVMSGNDVTRISDIIRTLNEGVVKSLEEGASEGGQELAIILALAQFTLEHMHATIGYTYANWFDTTFTHQRTSVLLNKKRASSIFISILQDMIPYELPGILQIHGRSLANCSQDIIPRISVYVSATKRRLLELGVNASFKSYPSSLKKPIPPAENVMPMTQGMDEIYDIIQQFIKKGKVIPASLLQSHVFRRQWFTATFLPKLLAWNGKEMEAKHQLILALKEKQKIPESMYKQYIERK
ncbi:MAG: hypothetical protein EXX96DRAFT_558026 [Benjaminiella poitrasii]|nr:MAG: hypothetical protein EXX96DRAFT_558026 [Benjaminiella poitrasii]